MTENIIPDLESDALKKYNERFDNDSYFALRTALENRLSDGHVTVIMNHTIDASMRVCDHPAYDDNVFIQLLIHAAAMKSLELQALINHLQMFIPDNVVSIPF